MEKNGTLASPAMSAQQAASAGARGPINSTPLGMRRQLLKFLRLAQELDDLLQLFLGLFDAGHALNVTFFLLR